MFCLSCLQEMEYFSDKYVVQINNKTILGETFCCQKCYKLVLVKIKKIFDDKNLNENKNYDLILKNGEFSLYRWSRA